METNYSMVKLHGVAYVESAFKGGSKSRSMLDVNSLHMLVLILLCNNITHQK